jgi:hypothetical protein
LAIAFVFGTYLGLMKAHSVSPFFAGFGLLFTMPTVYLERWCKLDGEKWSGEYLLHSVAPASAVMLFMWTAFYTYRVENSPEVVAMVNNAAVAYAAKLAGTYTEVGAVGAVGAVGGDDVVGAVGAVDAVDAHFGDVLVGGGDASAGGAAGMGGDDEF